MGAFTALVCKALDRIGLNLSNPGPVLGNQSPGYGWFEATGPASYDTGGSVIDLSDYFSSIDSVIPASDKGTGLSYVAGATTALGKFLITSAVGSHIHQIAISGGAAAAGTKTVQTAADSGATTFTKEVAGAATVPTNAAIGELGVEAANATNFSTVTARFMVRGVPA